MTTNDANQTSPANRPSLLAYLAYKFGGQTETIATEALGYILSRSTTARNALRDLIGNGGVDVGPIARVQTEVIGDKMERVDLSAYNDAGEERVLIEAKFWAGLTGNQPSEYLKRLPNDDEPAALLFVAPKMRLETLWPHIRGRAEGDGFALVDGSETGDLRTAAVAGSNRFLMLTSWRRILGDMLSHASQGSVCDILQLNGLCEQQDSIAFLPIKAIEFGPEFPRRMLNLQQLIDDATERLKQAGRASTDGLLVAARPTGYGRYIALGNKKANIWAGAWLGVDYNLWASRTESPLWIKFYGKPMSIDEMHARLGDGANEYPLPLETEAEYEEVLADLVGQLSRLADLLAAGKETHSAEP